MTETRKDLHESLQFQLSLLRLVTKSLATSTTPAEPRQLEELVAQLALQATD